MKKKISLGLALVLILSASLITFQTTYFFMYAKNQKDLAAAYSELGSYDKLQEVKELYENLYVGELDDEKLIDGIIAGYVAGTGDRYGAYYDAESFTTYMESMNGDMQGIGINVIYNADYEVIEVINVMPDSPALEAGVEPDDPLAGLICDRYFKAFEGEEVDALIMGCTHYPVYRDLFQQRLPRATMLDVGETLAESLRETVGGEGGGNGQVDYFVTERSAAFNEIVRIMDESVDPDSIHVETGVMG